MVSPRLFIAPACALALLASAAPALAKPKPDPAPSAKPTAPAKTPVRHVTPTAPSVVHRPYVAPRVTHVTPTVTPKKTVKKPVVKKKPVVHKVVKKEPVIPAKPVPTLGTPEAVASKGSNAIFWLLAALLVVVALVAFGGSQVVRRGRKAELTRSEQAAIQQVAGGYMESYFGGTPANGKSTNGAAIGNGDQPPLVSSSEPSQA
jgi:hypothetical protein